MKTEDLPNQPGLLIRRAHQMATAVFMEKTSAFDVTPVQFAALVVIRDNPGIDATRVSELVHFDRSTTGVVLGRLEVSRYISRTPGKEDRRTKRAALTKRGAELVKRIEGLSDEITETIVSPLGPQDRALLARLLDEIVNACPLTSVKPRAGAQSVPNLAARRPPSARPRATAGRPAATARKRRATFTARDHTSDRGQHDQEQR